MDQDTQSFFHSHVDGGSSCVVAAYVFNISGGHVLGLFSTLEKAHTWVDTFEDDHSVTACVFSPYVIDVPEFGNVSVQQRQ
jgi:hypothetical protein